MHELTRSNVPADETGQRHLPNASWHEPRRATVAMRIGSSRTACGCRLPGPKPFPRQAGDRQSWHSLPLAVRPVGGGWIAVRNEPIRIATVARRGPGHKAPPARGWRVIDYRLRCPAERPMPFAPYGLLGAASGQWPGNDSATKRRRLRRSASHSEAEADFLASVTTTGMPCHD